MIPGGGGWGGQMFTSLTHHWHCYSAGFKAQHSSEEMNSPHEWFNHWHYHRKITRNWYKKGILLTIFTLPDLPYDTQFQPLCQNVWKKILPLNNKWLQKMLYEKKMWWQLFPSPVWLPLSVQQRNREFFVYMIASTQPTAAGGATVFGFSII